MALGFPEAFESAHMGHPDFRIHGGKIFATLWPKDDRGVLILTPEQQEAFVETAPAMFVPVKGGWGLRGCTNVILKKASKRTLKVALAVAWRNAAPKRLAGKLERSR